MFPKLTYFGGTGFVLFPAEEFHNTEKVHTGHWLHPPAVSWDQELQGQSMPWGLLLKQVLTAQHYIGILTILFTGPKPLDGLLFTGRRAQTSLAGHCLHTGGSFFLQPDTTFGYSYIHLFSIWYLPNSGYSYISFSHLSLFLLSKSTTQLMIPANIRKPPETKKLMLYWFVASKIQPELNLN